MVKEKEGCNSCIFIDLWNGFNPFGGIIDDHDNILMVISGWWVKLHKLNIPFTESTTCDDRMEGSKWSSHLRGI